MNVSSQQDRGSVIATHTTIEHIDKIEPEWHEIVETLPHPVTGDAERRWAKCAKPPFPGVPSRPEMYKTWLDGGGTRTQIWQMLFHVPCGT